MDIVQAVKDGRGKFEWAELHSVHGEHTLILNVFRDDMKFDDVPPMKWHRTSIPNSPEKFNGVRLPATAAELQQVADLLNCMLLTPKILDLMWDEAEKTGTRFDSAVNDGPPAYNIVATMNIHEVHQLIEDTLARSGGDTGGMIMATGKYWVLVNELLNHPENWACNYGWYSSLAPSHRLSVTGNARVWQQQGYGHGDDHLDPSQNIRLMYRYGLLIKAGEAPCEIDLHMLAQDPELAPLISHQGVLKVLRQRAVEPTPALQEKLNLPPKSLIV